MQPELNGVPQQDAEEKKEVLPEETDIKTEDAPQKEEISQEAETNQKSSDKKKKEPKSLKMEIYSWIITILAAIALATAIRAFLFEPIRVDGTSMTDTLQDKEVVLAAKLPYLTGDVERNDVVICRYPNRRGKSIHLGASLSLDSYTLFVKRIVGLPGDTVGIENGKLFINGEEQPDPELMGSVPRNFPTIRLGPDQYFAMGDNRLTSHDSRSMDVGPLSRDMIMGKVTHVIWPLNRIRSVK